MLRWLMSLALLAALAPTPAVAGGFYNLKIGLNGMLTGPLDPFASMIWPSENPEDLPGAPVTNRMCGLVVGTMIGVFRVFAGATDVVTSPLWVIPSYSPEPRFQIIPGFDYEQ